ncbi:MAG: lipid-A-disaccharide synthase-related protein [Cyanobacteria bacterium]|nr:lipid-A-disaccharide synthase-related protein [Cyanobacteriota bacterium]
MKPVLLLSNGHGEDLSGALIAAELMQRGIPVEALPLVGHGSPYRQRGVPVLGRTRSFSTGGLGYTSLRSRLSELLEGQMGHVLSQLLLLLRRRHHYGLVVAVGDVLAVLGSWLSGLPSTIYLVAYSSHYERRLRLPWPCRWLLKQKSIKAIWSRDPLSANDLSQQLNRAVIFLGNPFLDVVHANPSESLPSLALVPGSRLPEAERNFALMLRVLALLPEEWARDQPLRMRAALIPELEGRRVAELAKPLGWRLEGSDRLVRGPLAIELGWGQFGEILTSSQLVMCMAGTAAEQAVGLGKPVLQLVGEGPQFTAGFAEAQRRLLGLGVRCAPGSSGSEATLAASALIAHGLLEQQRDRKQGPALRQALAALGLERIGKPGGSKAMAEAIMAMLRPNQASELP